MKQFRAIPLILFVCFFLGALGWGGLTIYRLEQRDARIQQQELNLAKLKVMRESLAHFVSNWISDVQDDIQDTSFTQTELRRLPLRDGRIQQMFIMDETGRLVFPLPSMPDLSDKEEQLLTRILPKIAGKEFFVPEKEQTHPSRTGTTKLSNLHTTPKRYYSWYSYFRESGLQPIHFFSNRDGNIVGVEVDTIRLLADIIGFVTSESSFLPADNNLRIELLNQNKVLLHQWGNLLTEQNSLPSANLPLLSPLSSWTLQIVQTPLRGASVFRQSTLYNLLMGGTLSALLVLLLAFLIYRQQHQQYVEAEQRVSFVNQVSHELKTPLTSIRMYAELLELHLGETPEKDRKRISIIVEESQRLSRLIENVLTFRNAERNAVTTHLSPSSAQEVIEEVIEQFNPLFEKHNLSVQYSCSDSPQVLLDPDILKQILGNLFSNICKHASTANSIRVSSSFLRDQTIIEVHDNGSGIPLKNQRKIFNAFFRGDHSTTQGAGGSGIGLSIAKTLSQIHGGDLTIEPSKEGALFRLVLETPIYQENGEYA